jgi:glutamate/tyrosine decarboxylase-like PLP-dependent enzyme
MGVELVANPELTVVTFKADDPEALQTLLERKGFRVNVIPRLSAIRIVCNPHVTRDVVRGFLAAMKEVGA